MILFYLLALIPLVVGGIIWLLDKEVVWQEWLGASAAAFLLAGLFHGIAIHGMTDDIETWSGQITVVTYCPPWVERWEEMHTRTVGSGKNEHTEIYYTTEYDHHREHWTADRDFGKTRDEIEISQDTYNTIKHAWGDNIQDGGIQANDHFGGVHVSGDDHYYVTYNQTGYMFPVTGLFHFSNRIKAAPSVFSFIKVPTNIAVYAWPENPNTFNSERVLGTATQVINTYQWDKLNAQLGPVKKINLIIVGFDSEDSMMGEYQKAKWVGGKKNDFVITYGGNPAKPTWCKVFGWTESELAKEDVSSYIMEHGITPDIYDTIKKEIEANYQIKDWHKFDYIRIEPSAAYYYWFFFFLVITQVGLYYWFQYNDFSKTNTYGNFSSNPFSREDSYFSSSPYRKSKRMGKRNSYL